MDRIKIWPFNRGDDAGEDDTDKYPMDVYLYSRFNRVTERIHFLDGSTEDVTYDTGLSNKFDNTKFFKLLADEVVPVNAVRFVSEPTISVRGQMIGRLNKAQAPYVKRLETVSMVASVRAIQESEDFFRINRNPLRINKVNKFTYNDSTVRVNMKVK